MKIALIIALALLIIGCSNDEKKEVAQAKTVEVKAVEETTMPSVEDIKNTVAEMEVPTVAEVKDSVVQSVTEASTVVKAKSAELAQEVTEVAETAMPSLVDAKAVYAACIGCHGANGEKKALGKSAAIQGWAAEKTIAALKGYKDGSYGGAMKALMKAQSDKLNDGEIQAIADYLSTL